MLQRDRKEVGRGRLEVGKTTKAPVAVPNLQPLTSSLSLTATTFPIMPYTYDRAGFIETT